MNNNNQKKKKITARASTDNTLTHTAHSTQHKAHSAQRTHAPTVSPDMMPAKMMQTIAAPKKMKNSDDHSATSFSHVA